MTLEVDNNFFLTSSLSLDRDLGMGACTIVLIFYLDLLTYFRVNTQFSLSFFINGHQLCVPGHFG